MKPIGFPSLSSLMITVFLLEYSTSKSFSELRALGLS
jgi:hypothetical protein